MKVEESLNVKFDETHPPSSPPLVDDDLLEVDIIENQRKDLEVKENEPLNKQISNIKESKDHPLETIATRIQMEYLPKRKWSKQDKKRAQIMINAIDKKLRDRRLMHSLEKFVGRRPYGGDLRLLQRTI
ncbi:hypothetical protein Tco_0794511 [Tanacetum coccineum]